MSPVEERRAILQKYRDNGSKGKAGLKLKNLLRAASAANSWRRRR
jgi:hypothetical protein